MMNAIEIEAEISDDHYIHVKLPDNWSSNKVKVIVLQEEDSGKTKHKREFGGLEGKVHIKEGFDDELPDSFWGGGQK